MGKKASKKNGKTIRGLIASLQSSGTGRPKLLAIAKVVKENPDVSPVELVMLLGQYGPPIGNGTVCKVRVYFEMEKKKKPRKMRDDLDDLLDDPMNPSDKPDKED